MWRAGHRKSLIQKLCGQGAAIDIPVDPEIRGDGTQEGVFPTQEGHGEDRWSSAMELWTEAFGPKGQGAKSDRESTESTAGLYGSPKDRQV